jgi:hypothetical protein
MNSKKSQAFNECSPRTLRVNEAVNFIYMMTNALGENKNRTNRNDSNLSCQVVVIPLKAGRPPGP